MLAGNSEVLQGLAATLLGESLSVVAAGLASCRRRGLRTSVTKALRMAQSVPGLFMWTPSGGFAYFVGDTVVTATLGKKQAKLGILPKILR